MKVTLGILAHVDAGKTTLAERILCHTNTIRSFGRVDDKSSYLDYSDIERERGITVFSDAARISLDGDCITIIDTPGHADFFAETERAISVMDYALLVVSAIEGVESHTEAVWQLLREYNVPTFIFINKTDAATADVEGAISDIRSRLADNAINFSEDFSEALAERSEALLEEYTESGAVKISDEVRRMVLSREIFPCICGSALRDENIDKLMEVISSLIVEKREDEGFSATCYKIRRDGAKKLAYLKINSGSLRVKDTVDTPNGQRKVDEIKLPSGKKLSAVQSAEKGEICVVSGLSDISCGDVIGSFPRREVMKIAPIFKARVIFGHEHTTREVYEKLLELSEEEPTLSVEYSQALDEIDISVMGKISLQVIEYEMFRRFGIKVSFGSCRVVYRETIKTPATGYGHFEPLRHYAEVHIRVEAAPEGSGISFISECSTDVLPRKVQNLIRTHVFEKAHKGILTGSELCDVRYILVTGRVHEKHTEGGDLREATYRAIRHSLMRGESTLLEPFYKFSARSDMATAGRIMADITKLGGSFTPPEIDGEVALTRGRAPARYLGEYAEEIISTTGGNVSFFLRFDGYSPCNDEKKIIEEIGYEPNRDVENTADSVFCAHGAGFNVKWHEVESFIHCR